MHRSEVGLFESSICIGTAGCKMHMSLLRSSYTSHTGGNPLDIRWAKGGRSGQMMGSSLYSMVFTALYTSRDGLVQNQSVISPLCYPKHLRQFAHNRERKCMVPRTGTPMNTNQSNRQIICRSKWMCLSYRL